MKNTHKTLVEKIEKKLAERNRHRWIINTVWHVDLSYTD